MKKHIVITGCAGFMGSNLTVRCIQEGFSVTGIDNFSYGRPENLVEVDDEPRFEFLERDVARPDCFEGLEGAIVIHLASQKIPRYTNSYRTLTENYTMLQNVIAFCHNTGSKLIYASTSDIYGKNPDVPYSEESSSVLGSPLIKRWAYAVSKLYGEHLILANHAEKNLTYTILRFFGSYGKNQNLTWWGGPQSGFIENAFRREPIEIHGDGTQTRTFTYVDDTIDGIFRAIVNESSDNQIFNVGSEVTEEITIIGLAKLIWGLINPEDSEPILKFIPYSTFGKYEDVPRRVPDITKIREVLGYSPKTGLKEGMEKTIIWQRSVTSMKIQ